LSDTGAVQTLTGSGSVRPLGTVQAVARLQLPGFIRMGRATGSLVLTGPHGTITLQLLGPKTTGFGGPLITLSYKITHATGQYAGASGNGVLAVSETSGGVKPSTAGSWQAFAIVF
jgi:hypothetical protein